MKQNWNRILHWRRWKNWKEASSPEKTPKKRKARATDAERFKGIPVEKAYLDLSEEEKKCPVCGMAMKQIGEEFVRRELVFIPAKLKVREYYSRNYECPRCNQRGIPVIKKGKVVGRICFMEWLPQAPLPG